MDSELRRRFLQILDQDFAAIELLREMQVAIPGGRPFRYAWPLEGSRRWTEVREWWLGK